MRVSVAPASAQPHGSRLEVFIDVGEGGDADGLGAGQQALAVDLSLAALLGDDIYNFGELLSHPVVRPPPRPTPPFPRLMTPK